VRSFEDVTLVAAPPAQVATYLNTPDNWVVVMPSAVAIRAVEELETGGHRFSFVHTLAGIRSHATAEVTEFEPDERLVVHIEDGMTGDYQFEFTAVHGGTRVELAVDYELTGGFRNRLIGAVSTSDIDHQFETMLATLKNRVEMRADAATAQ
jgi:uncharacterized protein YndB with AHSA1/START domain